MKAKEYFEKYEAYLIYADEKVALPAAHGIVTELMDEIGAVAKARHVQFDRGIIPIFREQNEKYKAVVRLFEKKYGASPIREDGLEIVFEHHFPGVVEKMKGRAARGKIDTHTREGVSDA